ncbi:MAG TPA: hypothetical protein VFI73_04860 [Candidatus Nitrosopolaris sp.]|nr:hypothetical protein [Candidatus Nitrosopolaris sp.]
MERSALFKIMNTYQPSFYLRLRRHREPFNKDEQDAVTRLRESNLVEEVQSKKKSFLGREIVYALTTSGLFHIFSKPLSYPPQLLIRYQDNIILSALLFPYFEVDTIERSTARFYFMITQYLQECCRTTLNRIDAIKRSTSNPPEMDPSNQKRQVELLESDLRLHAKVIAFKLGVAHSESTILAMANSDGAATDSSRVALYDLESSMKTVLSKDRKFMQLLKEVQKDFENGYKELVELK